MIRPRQQENHSTNQLTQAHSMTIVIANANTSNPRKHPGMILEAASFKPSTPVMSGTPINIHNKVAITARMIATATAKAIFQAFQPSTNSSPATHATPQPPSLDFSSPGTRNAAIDADVDWRLGDSTDGMGAGGSRCEGVNAMRCAQCTHIYWALPSRGRQKYLMRFASEKESARPCETMRSGERGRSWRQLLLVL